MARNLQSGVRLRPVDLARAHGLSTQAIRNYEADDILPLCERTPHGYRMYTDLHAQALRAFLALIPGHSHRTAVAIMQAINRNMTEDALRLLDESHAQLLEDRRTLEAVEQALHDLENGAEPQPARSESTATEPGTVFIGLLAARLGVQPATLRKWESSGLIGPHRNPHTGYRVYDEADIRDALLIRQLRRGGYLLQQISPLLAQVRTAGGLEPLAAVLHDWHGQLAARGRAMLSGASELDQYLHNRV